MDSKTPRVVNVAELMSLSPQERMRRVQELKMKRAIQETQNSQPTNETSLPQDTTALNVEANTTQVSSELEKRLGMVASNSQEISPEELTVELPTEEIEDTTHTPHSQEAISEEETSLELPNSLVVIDQETPNPQFVLNMDTQRCVFCIEFNPTIGSLLDKARTPVKEVLSRLITDHSAECSFRLMGNMHCPAQNIILNPIGRIQKMVAKLRAARSSTEELDVLMAELYSDKFDRETRQKILAELQK